MTARAAAVPIWMFGSGMAKTVVFDRELPSAVAWMRWDLFFGFQTSVRIWIWIAGWSDPWTPTFV